MEDHDQNMAVNQELIDFANNLYSKNQFIKAESIYRAILQDTKNNLDALAGLINSLCKQNKIEESIQILKQSLNIAPFFPHDNDFISTYLNALQLTKTPPTPFKRYDKFYNLMSIFKETLSLDGFIAECGCFRGLSSYLLCSELRKNNPSFTGEQYQIFDSFQGLSDPTEDDDIPAEFENSDGLKQMCRRGAFSASLEEVKTHLSQFPNIEYYPGWIPLSFPPKNSRWYKFVHIDVDLYDPTMDSLQYFYPRLVKGGYIVSDDYGWPGAKKAIQEFCEQEHISFSVNLYNQAIISK